MKNIDKKCSECGELLRSSQYASRVPQDGTVVRMDDHLVCRNFPFCKLAEKEVDKKVTCNRLFQRLIELRDGFKDVSTPKKPIINIISSRDIDQLRNIETYLIERECLDEMPKDELFKIYTDDKLGPKAREVLRKRRIEGDLI